MAFLILILPPVLITIQVIKDRRDYFEWYNSKVNKNA